MSVEEVELWEVLIPCRIVKTIGFNEVSPTIKNDLDGWYSAISCQVSGITIYSQQDGYWQGTNERSYVVRIACNQTTIELIMEITAKYFKQETVMAYKISNRCLMYHND